MGAKVRALAVLAGIAVASLLLLWLLSTADGTFESPAAQDALESSQRICPKTDPWDGVLDAMSEQTLGCHPIDGQIYRFLWVRTFRNPLMVRVQKSGTGASLTGVELGRALGDRKVIRRIERELTPTEWKRILDGVDASNFWSMPTVSDDDANGYDGADWVVQGKRGAEQRTVVRWSASAVGPYRELCLTLLGIADMLPEYEEDIY